MIPLAFAASHIESEPTCGNHNFSPCIESLEHIGNDVKVTWSTISVPEYPDEPQSFNIWSTIGEPVEIGGNEFTYFNGVESGVLIPYREGMCVSVQAVWVDIYYRTNSPDVCFR